MFKQLFLISVLINSCFLSLASYANQSTYYNEHTQGWYWYKDPVQQPTEQLSSQQAQAKTDPIAAMKQLHKRVNRALDKAFFDPTRVNLKQYMVLQNLISNRAALFTERWKQVLVDEPNLDYSIKHPTSTQGRNVYLAQYQKKQDVAINDFAKHDGLFFFYRGDCPYCHRFAPILKTFAGQYGIHVIPISLGAGFLPEFPHSRVDEGQAALLHVQVYPSLFAVNPRTQKIVPVAYGLMTYEALRQRILEITTQFRGNL